MKYFVKIEGPHSEYPLMSKAIKAAQQRCLVPVILELMESDYDDGTPERKWRTECLKYLSKYYEIIEGGGMFLTTAEYEALEKAVEKTLIFYGALASKAMTDSKYKWSTVNKHHFFFHLGRGARWINPRVQWCYMAEDFMRHISKVASAIMVGSNIRIFSKKVSARWRIGRFTRALSDSRIYPRAGGRGEGSGKRVGGGQRCSQAWAPRRGVEDFELTRNFSDS